MQPGDDPLKGAEGPWAPKLGRSALDLPMIVLLPAISLTKIHSECSHPLSFPAPPPTPAVILWMIPYAEEVIHLFL